MGQHSARLYLVAGEAVEMAAWLEQAASPGEILLGKSTYRLVRHAVKADPAEPLSLQPGRKDPLICLPLERGRELRLLRVPRRLKSPMVGRGRELALLQDAFERAVHERSLPARHPVSAQPGSASRGSRANSSTGLRVPARILQGRCLAYGEGITFWPVAGDREGKRRASATRIRATRRARRSQRYYPKTMTSAQSPSTWPARSGSQRPQLSPRKRLAPAREDVLGHPKAVLEAVARRRPAGSRLRRRPLGRSHLLGA